MYKQFLLRFSVQRIAVKLEIILDCPVSFCTYILSYLCQSFRIVHEL